MAAKGAFVLLPANGDRETLPQGSLRTVFSQGAEHLALTEEDDGGAWSMWMDELPRANAEVNFAATRYLQRCLSPGQTHSIWTFATVRGDVLLEKTDSQGENVPISLEDVEVFLESDLFLCCGQE